MFKTFYKCQSLGNDFILLDWLDKDQVSVDKVLEQDDWCKRIRKLCSRNFGIGADGVLIVKKRGNNCIEGIIFNADGSKGEVCLNGLRCIGFYLMEKKDYPTDLTVFMKNKMLHCFLRDDDIGIEIGDVIYKEEQAIEITGEWYKGHIVDVGNPHFVVLSHIDEKWLQNNGRFISENRYFSNQTNVEFIWKSSDSSEKNRYQMLVYERGCGMTLSCGSGAAAVVAVLHKLNKIKHDEMVFIDMLGGSLKTSINNENKVIQLAQAEIVFSGSFE